MSALISDVIAGQITPAVCNAAVNAGGKLLKVVEMQHKYGTASVGGQRQLDLCRDETREDRIDRLQREIADLRG